ncbi:MAG: TetR/AcrR family transcriptional regulator [Thiobacillaceae bacterium]|jgi:AcrR family transcriptional regulator|nr:TetR/AcrR family transcriptional regulator [Thiobacillaceae bacterium]
MSTRKYTKTRRAEQQDQTRARIVDATVKLHESLGPAQTSIMAIAEAAGVQRLTVYRHFPDEASLFEACTTRYLELHPPPQPAAWADIERPGERSRTALLAFYQYYRQTEKMWRVAYRDVDRVVAMQAPMDRFEAYLDQVTDDLVQAWHITPTTRKSLKLTLRHALRFTTWQSLNNATLKDRQIAELVQGWLAGIGKNADRLS